MRILQNFFDTLNKFYFEDPYEVNQDLEIHNAFSNPLFQLEEVKDCDTTVHTPLMCTLSFNNDDEFKGLPMFLNPLYASLEYDDHTLGEKIASDGIMMLDEFIITIFDIQTLNHNPEVLDPIDAFSIRHKIHLVGWHILKGGNHLFWVFTGHFPSPYAFVGWKVGKFFLHNALQASKLPWEHKNAFLYTKFHPI